jgi:hypothetical protein
VHRTAEMEFRFKRIENLPKQNKNRTITGLRNFENGTKKKILIWSTA